MIDKIKKLIEKYEEEVKDMNDEFSHGDAMARINAYSIVIQDLEKILSENE